MTFKIDSSKSVTETVDLPPVKDKTFLKNQLISVVEENFRNTKSLLTSMNKLRGILASLSGESHDEPPTEEKKDTLSNKNVLSNKDILFNKDTVSNNEPVSNTFPREVEPVQNSSKGEKFVERIYDPFTSNKNDFNPFSNETIQTPKVDKPKKDVKERNNCKKKVKKDPFSFMKQPLEKNILLMGMNDDDNGSDISEEYDDSIEENSFDSGYYSSPQIEGNDGDFVASGTFRGMTSKKKGVSPVYSEDDDSLQSYDDNDIFHSRPKRKRRTKNPIIGKRKRIKK